ncbi:MAG: UDP-3-O-(3-hydroxymyristoyl)glucosamine N-acyltransferase [Flavobacteriaceae bacterium]
MIFTAKEIAHQLDGTVVGDPETEVSTLSKIEEAQSGSITFLANPKYTPHIYHTKASITIVNKTFEPESDLDTVLIQVEDAYAAFTKLLDFYQVSQLPDPQLSSTAVIDSSVQMGEQCHVGAQTIIEGETVIGDRSVIHPQVFIGKNVRIGEKCVIYPGVRILEGSHIGARCIIHSGTVIGSDGFGFAPQKDGSYQKIPQLGTVWIGNDVEIGANSTIDRATLGQTKIGHGVKLDNQIQVAHNAEIDDHTVIAAQSGVAGSAKVGKHCVIGGQVGIVGHIEVGDHVQIQGQSGVSSNVPANTAIQGTPAFTYKDYSRSYIYFKKLPELVKQIETLEKKSSP